MKYYNEKENGKREKIDTDNLVWLYGDERWRGGRPFHYWMTKSKKRFFVENQTQWQGEHNTIEEVTRVWMISLLINASHQERASNGLSLMNADDEIEEVQ